jgi:hypothetical protein
MRHTAAENPKVAKPVYHFGLSLEPGEAMKYAALRWPARPLTPCKRRRVSLPARRPGRRTLFGSSGRRPPGSVQPCAIRRCGPRLRRHHPQEPGRHGGSNLRPRRSDDEPQRLLRGTHPPPRRPSGLCRSADLRRPRAPRPGTVTRAVQGPGPRLRHRGHRAAAGGAFNRSSGDASFSPRAERRGCSTQRPPGGSPTRPRCRDARTAPWRHPGSRRGGRRW